MSNFTNRKFVDIGVTIPVIAGLSSGIAMIIVFALIFGPPASPTDAPTIAPTVLEPTYHVNLTIVGMKDSYRVGGPISFTLRVNGYGYYCQSPNAAIWNASSAFASIPIWRSGLPILLCQSPQTTNHIVDDNYSWGLDRNITIEEPGRYVLGARIASDPAVQKEFTVIR